MLPNEYHEHILYYDLIYLIYFNILYLLNIKVMDIPKNYDFIKTLTLITPYNAKINFCL